MVKASSALSFICYRTASCIEMTEMSIRSAIHSTSLAGRRRRPPTTVYSSTISGDPGELNTQKRGGRSPFLSEKETNAEGQLELSKKQGQAGPGTRRRPPQISHVDPVIDLRHLRRQQTPPRFANGTPSFIRDTRGPSSRSFNHVAALTVMVWDYLIRLEDETELFWVPYSFFISCFRTASHEWLNRKGTHGQFPQFCFFGAATLGFSSLFAISPNLTDSLCLIVVSSKPSAALTAFVTGYSWLRVEGWIGISVLWSTQELSVILQLRIYALYNGSPRIAALIVSAFLVEVVAVVGIVAEAVGNLVRCKITDVPPWLWVFWVAVTSFELLLCILAIYKGYERLPVLGHSPHRQVLQDILVRDSVLYYLGIQIVYIVNLIFWIKDTVKHKSNPQESIFSVLMSTQKALTVALPSVLGSRLMINVRHTPPSTNTLVSPSDISLDTMSLPHLSLPYDS
ncbi:hypothetical protein C8R43DRAFT_950723 [Mycena crocata]|nr:hypothetical protein C8R43DRAFT_950723 [Mycena crocata]